VLVKLLWVVGQGQSVSEIAVGGGVGSKCTEIVVGGGGGVKLLVNLFWVAG